MTADTVLWILVLVALVAGGLAGVPKRHHRVGDRAHRFRGTGWGWRK